MKVASFLIRDETVTVDERFFLSMPSEKTQNLQDVFLNYVRKNKVSLTVFLVNGVKLQGCVSWFDTFCILLRRDGCSQLIYKHAISTIMPSQPLHLFDNETQEEEDKEEQK